MAKFLHTCQECGHSWTSFIETPDECPWCNHNKIKTEPIKDPPEHEGEAPVFFD